MAVKCLHFYIVQVYPVLIRCIACPEIPINYALSYDIVRVFSSLLH